MYIKQSNDSSLQKHKEFIKKCIEKPIIEENINTNFTIKQNTEDLVQDSLQVIRERRRNQLKQTIEQNIKYSSHGRVTTIREDEFLPHVTKESFSICHFFHTVRFIYMYTIYYKIYTCNNINTGK